MVGTLRAVDRSRALVVRRRRAGARRARSRDRPARTRPPRRRDLGRTGAGGRDGERVRTGGRRGRTGAETWWAASDAGPATRRRAGETARGGGANAESA